MKRDITQAAEYEGYAGYINYYSSYFPYSSEVELEAAKQAMSKRGYSCYETYTPYSAAVEAEANKAPMAKRAYSCYQTYTPYPAAVEAEAKNMDTKVAKRHMMNMPEEMMDDIANSEKRHMPKKVEAAGDAAYKSYT
jgi:hypothetical protein